MISKSIATSLFLVALAGGLSANATVKIGQPSPDFTLVNSKGETVKLSQFKDKTVVLEWFNPECPYVKKFYDSSTMQAMQKEHTAAGGVWLTIASSAPGKEGYLDKDLAKKTFDEKNMSSTHLLLDSKGTVGRLYAAKTTPHMYVIDKGVLVYQGAIDDRPSATSKSLSGAQNYVRQALTSLSEAKPITMASTKPYGCSVKY